VVAELARANPAAFRSMFAEAAKVLAGLGLTNSAGAQAGSNFAQDGTASGQAGPALRDTREGWGNRQDSSQQNSTQQNSAQQVYSPANGDLQTRRQDAGATLPAAAAVTNHQPSVTNHESRVTNHESPVTSHQSPPFDPVAYSNFERSTNDAVGRDVRTTIGDTLARVLPEGVAEGAARRIGDDIFNEVHRALAADRTLSEQVGEVLRAPVASGQGWRFGNAEQQRVASLLAGRAKQLVPSVARRVIGEWTSSVLVTARSKAARQAAAASRVDIAAPGGSRDSMPLRAMSTREVNYASMSDDEILGM